MGSKTLLIARHEFVKTVRKKGFIFATLIMPLIILIFAAVLFSQAPAIMESFSPSATGFVDDAGILKPADGFIAYTDIADAANAVKNNEIPEFFVLPADYVESGRMTLYTSNSMVNGGNSLLAIGEFIRTNLVGSSDLPENTADRIINPSGNAKIVEIDSEGQAEEERPVAMIMVPMLLAFMLIFSILTSSGYLMQGIGEEKESRSGEMLLSSVSADQLLRGKILGYGGVGFLQMGIWFAMAAALILLSPFSNLFAEIQLSWMFVLTIVYFVLGYFLYSVSISCTAAISTTTAEAQQTSMIFTMFAIIPLILLQFIMSMPDNPLITALTYFPYTSPFITIFRLSFGSVPPFQIVASLAILVIAIIVAMKLSAGIFRMGMLMYGKRANLKEVLRFLRN